MTLYADPTEERLDRSALEALQRRKLASLLQTVRSLNPFYRTKLAEIDFDPARDSVDRLPFTTRAELQADQAAHPPYGSNRGEPIDRYTRLHQTSASSGRPLRWLDTPQSWGWFKRCWSIVLRGCGVVPGDRLVFPFSFGPFIGFWAAFESASDLRHLCLAAGGMSTSARLQYLLDNAATVVCCTPTYALRMAEVARQEKIDLASSAVRLLVVAGEPGGCVPATRAAIESAWGAAVRDHAGMTEIGAWGFEAPEAPGGLLIIENEFIAEVIDPVTGVAVDERRSGELVLTNLGRTACPLIRYRTGDQVRVVRRGPVGGRHFAWCEGGVLGRLDDMLIIRGNNVFPSAIEGIVRTFPEVTEFRIVVRRRGPLNDLLLEVETTPGADARMIERIEAAIRDQLHFRAEVRLATTGALPRFELKSRRVVFEEIA